MSAYYSQHSCVGPSKEDHHSSAFNPRLAFWWNNQGEWEGRMTLRALTAPHKEKKLNINRCSVRPMWVVKWLEIRRSFSLPLSTLLFLLNDKNEWGLTTGRVSSHTSATSTPSIHRVPLASNICADYIRLARTTDRRQTGRLILLVR